MGSDALLQVGVGEAVSGRSEGVHSTLDIHSPLYVGGIPIPTDRILDNLGVAKGFSGCIHGLKVGQRSLDLVSRVVFLSRFWVLVWLCFLGAFFI